MNNALALAQPDHGASAPDSGLYSDQMLAELVFLNEDMAAQLRLERSGPAGRAEFVTSLIDHHEKTAAMLRAALQNHEPDTKATRRRAALMGVCGAWNAQPDPDGKVLTGLPPSPHPARNHRIQVRFSSHPHC